MLDSNNERILIFDIETSSLLPTRGRMLSCSFMWLDESKPFNVVALTSDVEMTALLATKWRLETAPIIMGFSSIRFDIGFMNKRLGMYGYDDIYQSRHIDVQKMYTGGRDIRISLETVAKELGVMDENVQKRPYDSKIWRAAAEGHEQSMRYIVDDRAGSDLELTKRCYLKMIGEEWETDKTANPVETGAVGLAVEPVAR